MARLAEFQALDARVPGCPDWDVEALLRHKGRVHRWDTESAYGEQVAFEPDVAGELLTEWLRIAGEVVHNQAGPASTIRFAVTDADLDLTAALGERLS